MFLEEINFKFVRLFCLDILILVEIDALCSTCKYILPINDTDFHCRVKFKFKARKWNTWEKNCNILIRSAVYFCEKKAIN